MDTNQNVRQHPVSAQNNKNSLKMINTIEPVTWNNQDLHSTKQEKKKEKEKTDHHKERVHLDAFQKVAYSESFCIGMN